MPRTRTAPNDVFRVGGDDRRWPSVTAAISLAQFRACRSTVEIQFGVYEGDEQVARVVRLPNGVVLTTTVAR